MSDSNEEQVLQELKRIGRLLALILIKDAANKTEQIEMLDRYGFQAKDMADLLGSKLNIVTATLSRIRKAKSEKVKKPKQAKISKPDDKQGT